MTYVCFTSIPSSELHYQHFQGIYSFRDLFYHSLETNLCTSLDVTAKIIGLLLEICINMLNHKNNIIIIISHADNNTILVTFFTAHSAHPFSIL